MKNVDAIYEKGFFITIDGDDRLIDGGFMAVHDGKIVEVGTVSSGRHLEYDAEQRIDCSGKILMPGFISTHTHLFQTLLKGLGRDKPLFDWLDNSVKRAFHYFNEEYIMAAALAGLVDNVSSGTTTVMDHQYCHARPGLDFVVAEAFEELGMRGVIASSRTNSANFSDDENCYYVETEEQYFESIEKLINTYDHHEHISVALAPCIIWDLTRDAYVKTRELADKYRIPITMHVAETGDDDKYCLETHGADTISFLRDCGVLGPDFSAVHSVSLDDKTMNTIVKSGSSVIHCPAANMILGSGRAKIPELQKAGVNVSLACDGPASNDNQDMLETIKLMALHHKLECRDPSVMPAYEALKMATLNGAKTIGQDHKIGSLEAGKEADFFIYNPSVDPASMPINDPVSAMVYSATSRGVEDVYVRGRAVKKNGLVKNQEEIMANAQSMAGKLIEEAGLGGFRNKWVK